MKPRDDPHDVNEQLKALPFVDRDGEAGRRPVAVVTTCLENQDSSPASRSSRSSCASTRSNEIGAHLFGTVGEVDRGAARQTSRYRGVELGDRVGQSGIEYSYDRYLRGENGASRVQVDALGVKHARGRSRDASRSRGASCGSRSTSTCSRSASRRSGTLARRVRGRWTSRTARSSRSASSPSFDPNVFAKVIREQDYRAPDVRGQRRAAVQPRDPGRLPDGLDVQARSRPWRRSRAG